MEQSPATTSSPYPFGLGNATTAYQCFALDLITTTATHTHADSSEEDEAWAGADFSELRAPKAMRRFMAASNYCFGYSDSDDEDTYDPTRECFNVELEVPTTSDEDEGAGNRSSPHEELRRLDLE